MARKTLERTTRMEQHTSATDPSKMTAKARKSSAPAAEVLQNAEFAFPRWARSLFFHASRLAWEAIFCKSHHLKDESAILKTALAFERCCKNTKKAFPRRARTRKKSSSGPAWECNFQLLQHLPSESAKNHFDQNDQNAPVGAGGIY